MKSSVRLITGGAAAVAYFSGWKTTLLTSVFLYGHPFLTSLYYADGIVTDVHIQMFADIRWVGFLPPVAQLSRTD
jgi:hypothetical protein